MATIIAGVGVVVGKSAADLLFFPVVVGRNGAVATANAQFIPDAEEGLPGLFQVTVGLGCGVIDRDSCFPGQEIVAQGRKNIQEQ